MQTITCCHNELMDVFGNLTYMPSCPNYPKNIVISLCTSHALIRPLLKKSSLDPNVLKNFRPVSNLPFLSKILEKIVLHQLNRYVNKFNLNEEFQSAYKEFHSTETALIKVVNDLAINADNNEVTILCLLDLSAAFDTIDHTILMKRLEIEYGIKGVVLKWFHSYLSNRTQAVVVDGVKSEDRSLKFGVPQGSVLGPILFTMYMKPLSRITEKFNLNDHFYADDSQLYKSTIPKNIPFLATKFEECFCEIKSWMNENKLMLNDEKTEVILVGRNSVLNKVDLPSLTFGSNIINVSRVVRNLGVYIDNNLTFSDHVNHMVRNVYVDLKRLRNIRHLISHEVLVLLVNSVVLSKLDYCNCLLANATKSALRPLQIAQNDAARLVFGRSRHSSATDLLKQLHWLPIEQRIKYKVCTHVFKSLHSQSPGYVTSLLNRHIPSRNLRSQNQHFLVKPKTHRKIGEQSFAFSGPLFWNGLPGRLRESDNLQKFKSDLKTFLFPK